MTITIQPSLFEEEVYLTQWLSEPETLQWFPLSDAKEIEDAVKIWMGYSKLHACFTAFVDQEVAGIVSICLQPYIKLSHQSLFSIVVGKQYRNRGVGKALLEHIIEIGKTKFHLEILHLEVYEGNPAIRFYQRLGFKEYGRHPHFIKIREGEYLDKIMMEKPLSTPS